MIPRRVAWVPPSLPIAAFAGCGRPPPGLQARAFATGLGHPRNLYVLPGPPGFRDRAMALVEEAAAGKLYVPRRGSRNRDPLAGGEVHDTQGRVAGATR